MNMLRLSRRLSSTFITLSSSPNLNRLDQYKPSTILSSLFSTITSSASSLPNHFDTLGLPTTFDLDHNTLSARLKSLQTLYHPDKNPDNHDISANLNAAYDVLRHPHRRAVHLLRLLNPNLNTSASDDGGDDDVQTLQSVQLPPQFLMWVMNFREDLQQAISDNQPSDVIDLYKLFYPLSRQCLSHLHRAFHNKDYDDATLNAAKLQYFHTIQSIFDQVQPRFDIDFKQISSSLENT